MPCVDRDEKQIPRKLGMTHLLDAWAECTDMEVREWYGCRLWLGLFMRIASLD